MRHSNHQTKFGNAAESTKCIRYGICLPAALTTTLPMWWWMGNQWTLAFGIQQDRRTTIGSDHCLTHRRYSTPPHIHMDSLMHTNTHAQSLCLKLLEWNGKFVMLYNILSVKRRPAAALLSVQTFNFKDVASPEQIVLPDNVGQKKLALAS